MIVNSARLFAELVAANVPVDGCASDGRIDFRPEATPEQRAEAAAILAAHDPSPTYAEQRAEEYPPTSALVVALWEHLIEGRPEAAQALQAKRAAVKAQFPKE